MLAAPAFREIEGVTIFVDDLVWYRFYPIPPNPRVRLDKNGNPVFLLVKYAFSDEDRVRQPNLPPGGGYLNLDIAFDLTPDLLERVRTNLQEWVNAEWNRLKNGTPEERAKPAVNLAEPPKVEFGTPTWTSGKAALDAPQATELVSKRVAEAEPSLLAGNVAVFSMDLTSAGATFMQKALVGEEGQEGSDLTVLQVGYDLKFWARLPPVRIHVKADSEKLYQYAHKTMEGRGVDHCTTYDFSNTKVDTETARLSGFIDVQIDTGSSSLSDEVIEELRSYSLEMVKDMIESSFFTDDRPPSLPAGTPDSSTPPGRNGKKYLREVSETASMKIELNLEQRSVVEWPIHPQATMETFFRGMSAEQLRQYVKVVDLHDDFFKSLGLEIRVFADFEGDVISAVAVQMSYEGTDENGRRQEKNETVTFTSSDPQKWNPSLIGSQREYKYRYQVGFKNKGFGAFSEWKTSKSPDLNVAIPTPGLVKVDVLAGEVDFANVVEQVQVTLAYEDPKASIPREESVVRLSAAMPEARYERLIFDLWRQPLQFKCRFRLKSGEVIEDEEWQETLSHNQIVINQPFQDVLRVNLLPVGDGWESAVQAVVDLRYQDPANNYTVEESLVLKSKEEFRTWKVLPRNKDKRDFEYRVTASYKDGRFEQTTWKKNSGEETIPIEIKAQPRLKILVLPDNLDFAASPITEVTIRYRAAGVSHDETFVFSASNKTAQTCLINVPAGAPVEYTYQVTHNPMGRPPVVLPAVQERDTVVVLPPYRIAKGGRLSVQVLSNLVEFEKTPIVVVDLKYDDEGNEVHQIGSFNLTEKKTVNWEVEVKDVSRKLFGYQITYLTEDGQEHASDWHFQETPRIIVPKLMAAAANP